MKLKAIVILLILGQYLYATKIKDIANVIGVRDNQLIGYGLVVGLKGTGDGSSSEFTRQAISSMLQSVNVKVDPRRVKSKNVAAVIVTANLPAFSRHGDRLDVEVSSIGDAKSILGGTLILTPLKAVDGEVYALAQGTITKDYDPTGRAKKRETVAKIYSAAIVEREISYDINSKNTIRLSLKREDFQTATKIQQSVNSIFGYGVATAIDPRTIELRRPSNMTMVEFLARVNDLDIGYKGLDKVVIDHKSGTVVAGLDVAVDPVVISQGDLTLKIVPSSGAGNFDNSTLSFKNSVVKMRSGDVTVANIARVLQKLGAKPKDIIAVLETIKRAGGINAELEVI